MFKSHTSLILNKGGGGKRAYKPTFEKAHMILSGPQLGFQDALMAFTDRARRAKDGRGPEPPGEHSADGGAKAGSPPCEPSRRTP